MSKLIKVIASTGVLTLAKMAMGFVIAKVVAVYTGPSGMALLGQIQGVVTALTGIINAPVSNGIIKFTSEHEKSGFTGCSPWWRASLLWVAGIYIVLLPISLIISDEAANYFFGDAKYSWVVISIVLLLPLSALGTLCLSIINGLQKYKRFVAINFISVMISSIVMILLIINYNITGAIFAAVIQSSLIGVIVVTVNFNQLWMKLNYFIEGFDLTAFNDIGKYVIMAMTSALVMPVSLLIVRNVLVQYAGWHGAGLWQSVWKISEVYLGVITIALGTYYLPKLSQIKDSDGILGEIKSTAKVVVPIIIVAAIMIFLLRDFIISLLFTAEFRDARELFGIQLCGDIVKVVAWLYAFPMLSRCAVKWYLFTECFFGIVFISASYLLIPMFALHGANYAYLLSYILYAIVIISNVRRFIT
ncbi:O-antigen translocase [Citrobacter freundii]|uniref:O-antigen translocase n=2 Tax=Citrobacter freundii TaxID=546 RepID=UPI00293521CD|nr:O-antigen translocase [Citrobacter freundii]MDV2272969.1 O-antigen translocase [Citrobacter freundii]MEB0853159.1 O-antigen translocase [Citrobacter freundii]